ncbi:hypothetical protein ACFL6G_05065 [candidate division KSB1 bacterium]
MKTPVKIMRALLIIILLTSSAYAQINEISSVEIREGINQTVIKISGDEIPVFNQFSLGSSDPNIDTKLVIDIKNAKLNVEDKVVEGMGPVLRVRSSQWLEEPSIVRIVSDLKVESDYRIEKDENYINIYLTNYTLEKPEEPAVVEIPVKEETAPVSEEKQEIMHTLNLKGQTIGAVLELFILQYDMNIIISKDVARESQIDVFISDEFEPENLLETILIANQFKFVKRNNIYLIVGRETAVDGEKAVEIFELNYTDANDIMVNVRPLLTDPENVQPVTRSPMKSTALTIPSGGGGGGGAGGAAGGGTTDPLAGFTDLSSEDEGAAQRSDMFVVYDRPEIVERVRKLVEVLDRPIPQVQIAVKLVETRLGDNEKWGLNWTTIFEAVGLGGQATGSGMQGGAAGGATGGAAAGGAGAAGGINVPGLSLKARDFKFGTLSFNQFKAVLELLERREDSKLLNQPSITTLHNQEARIAVGSSIPYEVTQIGGAQGASGAGGATGGGMGGAAGGMGGGAMTTVQNQNIAIALSVLPKVNELDLVTLWVNPIVQEITGFTGRNNDLPITSTRTAVSQIRVKNGDVVIIGGLIKEDKIKTSSKVKFLGSIPLLGNLFKSTHIDTRRSELVIFITPTIIYPEDIVAGSSGIKNK